MGYALKYRNSQLLRANDAALLQRGVNAGVDGFAVFIKLGDDDRVLPGLSRAPHVVLHDGTGDPHLNPALLFRAQRHSGLAVLVFGRRFNFFNGRRGRRGARLAGHDRRADLGNPLERGGGFVLNNVVDGGFNVGGVLTHDFFHDGHVHRATLLHQPEGSAALDRFKLIYVTHADTPPVTVLDGLIAGGGVLVPHHRHLIDHKQRAAVVRVFASGNFLLMLDQKGF